LIASVLGWNNVIAATVTTAVGKRGLGSIEVERLRGVGIETQHPLSGSLIAAFSGVGLKATGYRNRLSMKWSKMLTNLLANASSAILNLSPAEIFNDARLFHLEKLMVQEAITIMGKMNIPIIDLPGTPVKLLVWLLMNLPEVAGRAILSQVLGKGRGGKMPSFHIDLYAGNPQSEVGYLNGAVVRAGAQLKIPTPVNRFLTSVLSEIVEGKLPRDHYAQKPTMLLTDLAKIRKE
jgi:2-dehydropantoate 2-reductase